MVFQTIAQQPYAIRGVVLIPRQDLVVCIIVSVLCTIIRVTSLIPIVDGAEAETEAAVVVVVAAGDGAVFSSMSISFVA